MAGSLAPSISYLGGKSLSGRERLDLQHLTPLLPQHSSAGRTSQIILPSLSLSASSSSQSVSCLFYTTMWISDRLPEQRLPKQALQTEPARKGAV